MSFLHNRVHLAKHGTSDVFYYDFFTTYDPFTTQKVASRGVSKQLNITKNQR